MLKIPQIVLEDVKNYRTEVGKYISGELDIKNFKPYGGAMGVYAERSGKTYMLRPRIPSGIITNEELKLISEIAEKYSHGKIHFTTRQDIQFHGVEFADTVEIMDKLLEKNLVSRGTGGNTARNVSCSPLSGVEKEEVFDVSPFALAAAEFLLKDKTNFILPRKYKIGFSNNEKDEGHAKISDLGFVAVKDEKSNEGFRVYGGGGLGGGAKPSIILRNYIEKDEVLYHVQAMKLLFEEHGDRQNKAKARIRHIVTRLGEEKFLEEYDRFYEVAKASNKIDNSELVKFIKIYKNISEIKAGESDYKISTTSIKQLQTKNRYSIYFQPENGNVSSVELNSLLEAINKLDYDITLRLSLAQGIYVNNVDGKDVGKVIEAGKGFYTGDLIEKSTACTGAGTCQLGILRSQDLASAIREKFSAYSSNIKNTIPKLYISGCPNSCGQHQIGEIGLFGKAKKVDGNLIPVYTVLFGGNLDGKTAHFGEEYGTLPAKAIPDFLIELAELKERTGKKSFEDFILQEKDNLNLLIENFSRIPSIEENPEYYKDFGVDEFFSLKK